MKDLAERVGLTITPCIERVKRLERDGVIMGYYARLNPGLLGSALLVFVEISLGNKSGNMFEQFRREVLRIPEVLECHLVSGDFDYLIKARIREISEYRRLLGDISVAVAGRGAIQELRGDGRNQGDTGHLGGRARVRPSDARWVTITTSAATGRARRPPSARGPAGRGAVSNLQGRFERDQREAFDDGWAPADDDPAPPMARCRPGSSPRSRSSRPARS